VQGYLTISAAVAGLALLSGCATPTAMHNVAATTSAHRASKTKPRSKTKKSATSTAEQDLTSAVAPVAENDHDYVAVSVDDLTTGTTASYNGTDNDFVTASIVKADILSTLLYQRQRSGQALSEDEQELATTMIENRSLPGRRHHFRTRHRQQGLRPGRHRGELGLGRHDDHHG
jgi:outer membrane murein-binding lipoprotein Lpp